MLRFLTILISAVVLLIAPAQAEISRDGSFVAAKACPALKSFRKGTNPGDVTLSPGSSYGVLAVDNEPASWVYLSVPGANPVKRWVAADCGTLSGSAAPPPPPVSTASQPDAPANGVTRYVLAFSWQPAFCEGHPRVTECRGQSPSSASARQFSLHGLWPQPSDNAYCGVPDDVRSTDLDGRWRDLPAVTLSAATRSALDAAMPGTQSLLERHEWVVHGTCYGAAADRYFSDAIAALQAVNASAVRELFANSIGQRLSASDIRAAFDAAFGRGAGDRVRISCDDDGGRQLISELTIGLSDKVSAPASFAASLRKGAPTDSGCEGGIVDPAGAQ